MAPQDDIINFAPGVTGVITLTSPLQNTYPHINLQGPGANVLTVQRSTAEGTPAFNIFNVFFATHGHRQVFPG